MILFLIGIGFLALITSIIYLLYHLIRKFKDKERSISKRLFYPLLFGGLISMIVGISLIGDSSAVQLQEEMEKNEALTTDNDSLKEQIEELENAVEELETKNKAINEDLKAAEDSLTDRNSDLEKLKGTYENYESEKTTLNNEIKSLKSKIEEKDQYIVQLEENKSSLQAEVDNLQSSSVASSSGSSSSTTAYYENCTAARNAGAAPVYAGDPRYGSHLDRDGDGVGCE